MGYSTTISSIVPRRMTAYAVTADNLHSVVTMPEATSFKGRF